MSYKYIKFKIHIYAVIFSIFDSNLLAEEMIFGEEMLQNGIKVTFEAAPKDTVYPEGYFLKENETDIHIEMLMNWTNESPEGSPSGGFIPYLNVSDLKENLIWQGHTRFLLDSLFRCIRFGRKPGLGSPQPMSIRFFMKMHYI